MDFLLFLCTHPWALCCILAASALFGIAVGENAGRKFGAAAAKRLAVGCSEKAMTEVARALREASDAKGELEITKLCNTELIRRNDPVETMKRIHAVLGKQTWPDNMNIAGCVETLYCEYRRVMKENAELDLRLRRIEQAAGSR